MKDALALGVRLEGRTKLVAAETTPLKAGGVGRRGESKGANSEDDEEAGASEKRRGSGSARAPEEDVRSLWFKTVSCGDIKVYAFPRT